MAIRVHGEYKPIIAASAYIDDTALVIGDVRIGNDSSVWPYTVIRGDVNSIEIGELTNVQDAAVLHVTSVSEYVPQGYSLSIGNGVTIGHRAVIHACSIGDFCLIGIGSIILDGAILHPQVLLGAGSLVPPGKELQGGYLWFGNPAKKIRSLTEKELAYFEYSASHYCRVKDLYLHRNKENAIS
ncbi:gamma carbonic anhydrase family protein [candidate division CSSED10-310 bacterium]|uniref:Gamma carbonic anhydrase family protein n=1 Tax=candidate division CSSED10-310 bacterium TaxID=2855610 RepID=A0ABV6Z2P8_UNCC1